MAKVSDEIGAQGVLLLGDNVYSRGVETNTSKRFQETFEEFYPVEAFKSLPFFVIAGNHDHAGNVQAQINYHGSPRWHFPELYYTLPFQFTSSSGVARTVDLIMIDTVDLCSLCEEEYVGCPLLGAAEDDAQWLWLENELEASTADFLWV
jgi:tartrate-resistant acid phosphatase type 5